jgi:glycosyltransferase involved in cell wall biosynthesis
VKLVASAIVKNERGRYLDLWIEHLASFCDAICLLDDSSDDGTYEWLDHEEQFFRGVRVERNTGPAFYEHEGKARQLLYEHVLDAEPTHVLAIDADEFIGDPQMILKAIQRSEPVFTLTLSEVWCADEEGLCIRVDGLWKARTVPILYRPQPEWRIRDRALACGREPVEVVKLYRESRPAGTSILHFGWARKSERVARAARYDTHDAGRFHQDRHLRSILWEEQRDRRLRLTFERWPGGLRPIADQLADRSNR